VRKEACQDLRNRERCLCVFFLDRILGVERNVCLFVCLLAVGKL